MFEVVEVGRSLSKEAYREKEPGLRTALLKVQRELKASDRSVVVIVSGVEGAGKGALVNKLHEWLDARGLQTHAFWDEEILAEAGRPTFWRYWQSLPARGQIAIMFGSW